MITDIQELEQQLRQGKPLHYTKFLNKREVTIAFPTETGLPFIYQHEMPVLVRIEGKRKMQAEPPISNGNTLQQPKQARAEYEAEIVVSAKSHNSLSFVTPNDHQQHSVGFDKAVQAYLPLKAKVGVDFEAQQLLAELQAIEPKKNTKVFQYSAEPYLARRDILDLKPNSECNDYEVVKDHDAVRSMQATVGKQSTGMAFRVQAESEEPIANASAWLHEQLHRNDPIAALLSQAYDANLPYTRFNLTYQGQHCSTDKVRLYLAYSTKQQQPAEQKPEQPLNWDQMPHEGDQQLKYLCELVSCGIHSARATCLGAQIRFEGEQKYQYSAVAAYANSPVDKKSRFLARAQKSSTDSKFDQYVVTVDSKGKTPNTNGLDYQFARDFDPTTTNEIEVTAGENTHNAARINLKLKLWQSQERKQYLDQTREAQECQKESQQGNTQLPNCANATAEANLLDQVSIKVEYKKVDAELREALQQAHELISHIYYDNMQENDVDFCGNQENGQLEARVRFEPDLNSVNISVQGQEARIRADDIPLNGIERQLYVPHPVFSVYDRLRGELYQSQVYWRKYLLKLNYI